ncbi:hypothetical protein XA68_11656 [Ophiocordyceps unilateralis]|uniref:Ergosterol biosynthetic protein 28 n=1 Tax=Ophiocordyceps unilateralis TaxID=268505 RepID=A0A2A9PGD4_OPHUN|nr:hypothetical protein XA68_11656 [Ophiocordyceps unilateralis]
MNLANSLLPSAQGLLPYYMLILSIIPLGNSVQTYATLHFTRRIYNRRFVRNAALPPASASFEPDDAVNKLVPASRDSNTASDQVTPLAGRLFGTWTLISSVVRCYAAYNLHLCPVYDIAIWTYVVAIGHFASELFVFRTMKLGMPQLLPLVLASCALIWMSLVRDHYVESG